MRSNSVPARKRQVFEQKIRRLEKEIHQIDEAFYVASDSDNDEAYYYSLEVKRENSVRAIVLQLHLAIEDVLKSSIVDHLLYLIGRHKGCGIRRPGLRATRASLADIVEELNFPNRLKFSRAIGVLEETLYNQLIVLNQLRNKCSHEWLLDTRIPRRRVGRPVLLFRNRNLWEIEVLKDFIREYGDVYLDVYGHSLASHGVRIIRRRPSRGPGS